MRLAVVVDTFPSLSETFISEKVKQLSARGWQVRIYCSKFNEDFFNELFEGNKQVSVSVFSKRRIALYFAFHPNALLKRLFRTLPQSSYKQFRVSAINRFKPDVIHFEFSGIGIDYMNDFATLKGRKVVSCRGSAEKVKLLIYEERKASFRELLKKVDAVHCVSEDMRKTVQPYCPDTKKIFVNYPSIDTVFFSRSTDFVRNKHFIILSVGRMTFQKGYGQGLLVMQRLKEKGASFTWLIVGGGPYKEEIVFKTRQLDLANQVVFAGPKTRNEVKELMERADIYYLPSVYEGIANVALEAMSMRLPVVCTNSGGMAEVIENNVNGFIAPVHDYEQQAAYLFLLYKDFDKARDLGDTARLRIQASFSIELQTDRYEKVYRNLIQKVAAEFA